MAVPVSAAAHIVLISAIVLVPIFWPSVNPTPPDAVRAFFYNPPPPPPPPLPKGSALIEKVQPSKPVTPDPTPVKQPDFTAPIPHEDKPITPEARTPETEQAGSPTGSDVGDAAGMEGGTEGGVVGGVFGGVVGGCIGCTGDGPVTDYDQPPRPIKLTRPEYPQDAFIKKIEGRVVLEILIDATGRVVRARVMQSIPALDEAARRTVMQWVFSPAVKRGQPVASLAQAPVDFRIY
jgi:protein TonB